MPSPLRLLQRALITLRYKRLEWFDRDYRGAMLWTREGFKLTAPELEARQMARLRALVRGFREIALCTEDAFAEYDELRTYIDLQRLPVLTRQGLQELWPRLCEVHRGRPVETLSTTGSTGMPVRVLRDRHVVRANEGCYIELAKMIGYRPGLMHIAVWSNNEALGLATAHFGSFSRLLYPRLVLRSLKADDSEFRRLYEAIMANHGCYLSGYTGMLAHYASQMQRHGLSVPPGQVILLCGGAEALGPREREILEAVFHVKAHDMYGTREVHHASWDCQHGTAHINPRLIPEVISPESGENLPEGQSGLLVFTDLFNGVTPVIRYRVGDYGAIRRDDSCPCGRRGWTLLGLQGRASEVIKFSDGTLVNPTAINPILYLYPQVTSYQLIRLDEARFKLLYCGDVLDPQTAAEIAARLSRILAHGEVTLEHSIRPPLSAGGKLSYFVDEWQDGGGRDG